MKTHKGFTLVEMLIVLGIVAILVAVVVSVLNPAEFFRQTRDSRRLSDLNQLDQALNLATLDNVSMGTASVVYVSIPDDTAATSTCPTLGLPDIAPWTYQCSNTTNYRKVDGTGWVPVNFSSLVTVPSALNVLPIDPTNSTSTGLYYTYVTGSWELTTLFESTKYSTKYLGVTATSTVYSLGNHTNISPNAIATRAGSSEGGTSVTTSTLTSDTATDLAATTATLNGTITSEGGASSTITGFDYGLTTSYTDQATSTYSGGTGSFHEHITGLTASTLYHFRAKSYNSQGWGYGADNTLTTSAPAPQTGYVDPESDTETHTWYPGAFGTTHWDRVGQSIRQPNIPSIDDTDHRISANQNLRTDIYNMTTLTVTSVSNITVWVYGIDMYGAVVKTVDIYMNGDWVGAQTIALTDSNSWVSSSFNGTWSQGDLDAMQVSLVGDDSAEYSFGVRVFAVYAVVTYTQ